MLQEATKKQKVAKPALSIYRFKVTLIDIKPAIWRRFEVHHAHSFQELHHILQTVMGWKTIHAYQFTIGNLMLTDEESAEMLRQHGSKNVFDAAKILINELLTKRGQTFTYQYDFGDGWDHKITLEEIKRVDRLPNFPRCLDGKRACPLENSGGTLAYCELLEILQDPTDIEYEELREWVGENFDPDAFSVATINLELEQSILDWE